MHLAVALDVPTVAVLQNQDSIRYAPRGEMDRVLFRPEMNQLYETLAQHPRWVALTSGG
jgi:hypothetical protein